MPRGKRKERMEVSDELKEMIAALNELPIEVLEQLNKNLDEIEEYNRTHALDDDDDPDWDE